MTEDLYKKAIAHLRKAGEHAREAIRILRDKR
jgi:hypothetical protein